MINERRISRTWLAVLLSFGALAGCRSSLESQEKAQNSALEACKANATQDTSASAAVAQTERCRKDAGPGALGASGAAVPATSH